ncbi:MAG: Gfo/Idh/MocA family protein [Eubacteriales bacterium]|jgi:predicted dehydrogenase
MGKQLSIALIGGGRFCRAFVPLFKAHPAVKKVYICDLRPERAEEFAKTFGVEIVPTFEEALASPEINAIGIFTQRDRHGEMAIRALEAGKNVYSAVPCAVDVADIREIARLAGKKRLLYSMGETGYYRAATMFCRREYAAGSFGSFVYAESQYNHDIRNMEQSFRSSGGEDWKRYAGIPPFFYPTHSTSMILGALPGVYATEVSAMGFRGSPRSDIFGIGGQNIYRNPFSNTAMLLRLSNGGIARVSENRCVGWRSPETYISQFYGTDGGYEFSVAHHHMATWDPEHPGAVIMRDVTRELQPASVSEMIYNDYSDAVRRIGNGVAFTEAAPIQDTSRMPESYRTLPNGHNGTHQFLVNDFCRAFAEGKLTPTNIWQTARFNIPGLIAHQSALQEGKVLEVPDLGERPADWEVIDA